MSTCTTEKQEDVLEETVSGEQFDSMLMQTVRGRKVLATPAVRRLAMENKVISFIFTGRLFTMTVTSSLIDYTVYNSGSDGSKISQMYTSSLW